MDQWIGSTSQVIDGSVSASEALSRFKEFGTKAAEQIAAAKKATGKTRVTSRDIDKSSGVKASPRVSKKAVTAMVGHVRSLSVRVQDTPRLEDGSVHLTLSPEEVEALMAMRDSLPAEPAEPQSADTDSEVA